MIETFLAHGSDGLVVASVRLEDERSSQRAAKVP